MFYSQGVVESNHTYSGRTFAGNSLTSRGDHGVVMALSTAGSTCSPPPRWRRGQFRWMVSEEGGEMILLQQWDKAVGTARGRVYGVGLARLVPCTISRYGMVVSCAATRWSRLIGRSTCVCARALELFCPPVCFSAALVDMHAKH